MQRFNWRKGSERLHFGVLAPYLPYLPISSYLSISSMYHSIESSHSGGICQITASSRAFAAIDFCGNVVSWGHQSFGGCSQQVPWRAAKRNTTVIWFNGKSWEINAEWSPDVRMTWVDLVHLCQGTRQLEKSGWVATTANLRSASQVNFS